MVNSFSINSPKNDLKNLPPAILPFAAASLMLCRRLFKTTPLFRQNIGVGNAKQRRCFKTSTSGALGVRLPLSGSPLGSDSPSSFFLFQ